MTDTAGTTAFMCPEMCSGEDEFSGTAADIWSTGVTLYVMLFGELPFKGVDRMDMMEAIINNELTLPRAVDPQLESLIRRLLDKDPELRMTMEQIREDPWVTKGGEWPLPPGPLSKDEERVAVTSEEISSAFVSLVKLRTKMSKKAKKAKLRAEVRRLRKALETAQQQLGADGRLDTPIAEQKRSLSSRSVDADKHGNATTPETDRASPPSSRRRSHRRSFESREEMLQDQLNTMRKEKETAELKLQKQRAINQRLGAELRHLTADFTKGRSQVNALLANGGTAALEAGVADGSESKDKDADGRAIQGIVGEHREALSMLTKQNEKLKKRMQEMTRTNKELAGEIGRLTSELMRGAEEVKEMKAKMRQVGVELTPRRRGTNGVNGDDDGIETGDDTDTATLKRRSRWEKTAKHAGASTGLSLANQMEQTAKIDELTARVQDLQERLKQTEADLEEERKSNVSLQQEVLEVTEDFTNSSEQAQSLQTIIDTLKLDLQEQTDKHREQVALLEDQLEAMQGELQELQDAADQKDSGTFRRQLSRERQSSTASMTSRRHGISRGAMRPLLGVVQSLGGSLKELRSDMEESGRSMKEMFASMRSGLEDIELRYETDQLAQASQQNNSDDDNDDDDDDEDEDAAEPLWELRLRAAGGAATPVSPSAAVLVPPARNSPQPVQLPPRACLVDDLSGYVCVRTGRRKGDPVRVHCGPLWHAAYEAAVRNGAASDDDGHAASAASSGRADPGPLEWPMTTVSAAFPPTFAETPDGCHLVLALRSSPDPCFRAFDLVVFSFAGWRVVAQHRWVAPAGAAITSVGVAAVSQGATSVPVLLYGGESQAGTAARLAFCKLPRAIAGAVAAAAEQPHWRATRPLVDALLAATPISADVLRHTVAPFVSTFDRWSSLMSSERRAAVEEQALLIVRGSTKRKRTDK
eukprot:TRINITY_DN66013_c6_g1_i2.p1 TRINITY_DN66013_c6_g1~~TRINITY_DN66013_c6_g1_i2.p1  ORF type:complete len:1000 (+),score=533.12 TRINITY_DN66013_c6_g1_i2:215-3001(+)